MFDLSCLKRLIVLVIAIDNDANNNTNIYDNTHISGYFSS